MSRKVRLRCAESLNPASIAASVRLSPLRKHSTARLSRAHSTYRRNGIPTSVEKRWVSRVVDSPTWEAAVVRRGTATWLRSMIDAADRRPRLRSMREIDVQRAEDRVHPARDVAGGEPFGTSDAIQRRSEVLTSDSAGAAIKRGAPRAVALDQEKRDLSSACIERVWGICWNQRRSDGYRAVRQPYADRRAARPHELYAPGPVYRMMPGARNTRPFHPEFNVIEFRKPGRHR